MSTDTLPVLPASDQDKTTAGNYFVSNYPPFSFWKPENVPQVQAAFDRPPREGATLGMYTHIPFCRKRCHFCYFKVYTDKNAAAIKQYLDAVITELSRYATRPFIGGRKPKYLYFGGGTPSYLSPEQLIYLTDGMKAILPWDAMEEVAFECEPGTINERKLVALKEIGVTRLSLGVEHFDADILSVNNRAHDNKAIYKAYETAREVGFDQINIDLIAGMVNETPEKWKDAVAKAIALDPECVTIYQMEIPFNTTIYHDMKESGQLVAPVADWHTKREWVNYAFGELEKHGYTVTSAYTAVKNPQQSKFLYRDELWHGADMLSLGVSSFGIIDGVHYQNEANIERYVERIEAGESAIFRAMTMSEDEKFIREFILQLKLGSVQTAYFKEKFGVDVKERFAALLATYQREGWVTSVNGTIQLSRDGLLQVDRLLHGFFLPQHRTNRIT
ncbi:MAG: coproporphyrinogen-III oxidase family protein [Phycisphaeraceae bacterium]